MYEELRRFAEQVLSACIEDPGGDWVQGAADEFRDRFPARPRGITASELLLSRELGPSVRDLFAANAPAEPLWDFEVPLPPGRPEAPSLELMSSATREERSDATWRYQRDLDEWNAARRRSMLVRWPWVWADAVLAMRGEG